MDIAREICTDSFYTVNSGTPRIPVTAVSRDIVVPDLCTFISQCGAIACCKKFGQVLQLTSKSGMGMGKKCDLWTESQFFRLDVYIQYVFSALDKVLTAEVANVEVEVEVAARAAWHQQETLLRARIHALEEEARDLREANMCAQREQHAQRVDHEAREAALLEELQQFRKRKLQLRQEGSTEEEK